MNRIWRELPKTSGNPDVITAACLRGLTIAFNTLIPVRATAATIQRLRIELRVLLNGYRPSRLRIFVRFDDRDAGP